MLNEMLTNKIMLMGDVHGKGALMQPFLNSDCDLLIQLGDFGFIWKRLDYKYNKFVRKFEAKYPNKTILVVPGNHENYDSLEKMPVVTIFGGKARRIAKNIFALERGEVFNINGKNFLAIGGADSIDKDYRLPGQEWWEQERISYEQGNKILEKIENLPEIDYVISHTCPMSFLAYNPQFTFSPSNHLSVEKFLEAVRQELNGPKNWFFGHWHNSFDGNYDECEFRCLNIGETLNVD